MELIAVLVVLLCGILFWCGKSWMRNLDKKPEDSIELVVKETATVVEDFLEAGRMVSILSGGTYQGTISARLQHRAKGRCGYAVNMYDSGDLIESYAQYKKKGSLKLIDDNQTASELELFLKKYGKYYDPERNALVYETRAAASLNQAQKAKMERMLSQKIGCHPLAAVESNSLIHTKDT